MEEGAAGSCTERWAREQVTGGKQQLASAKADCEKNKALGARCIF
jgi:hypothetical protein